jgi:hypothetical protein
MFRREKDSAKKYLGFSKEKFREELCEHLHRMGIDAEAVPSGSPEEIGAHSFRKNAGCVKVKNRNIDMVQGVTWGASDGSCQIFRVDFLVRGKVNGLEKQLEAKAKEKKTGLVRRTLIDVKWTGGHLADLLNEDSELKNLLIQYHENPSAHASPKIQLDKQNQCVRIAGIMESTEDMDFTSKWKFPSKEYVEACDRIAKHLRTIL